METHDIVAQENDSWDHFNTGASRLVSPRCARPCTGLTLRASRRAGWMWIRHSQAASDAWREVLKMDLVKTSRDQNNFNEVRAPSFGALGVRVPSDCSVARAQVLGTALLRQHTDGGDPRRKPLLADFTAKNGLRVHVLDDNVFRSHHFEIDRPYAARDQSVYLHMTCGDDTRTKVYVAKAQVRPSQERALDRRARLTGLSVGRTQGFWSDVSGYYSQPPPLLTVDHLSGERDDVEQLFKILLMAACVSFRLCLVIVTSPMGNRYAATTRPAPSSHRRTRPSSTCPLPLPQLRTRPDVSTRPSPSRTSPTRSTSPSSNPDTLHGQRASSLAGACLAAGTRLSKAARRGRGYVSTCSGPVRSFAGATGRSLRWLKWSNSVRRSLASSPAALCPSTLTLGSFTRHERPAPHHHAHLLPVPPPLARLCARPRPSRQARQLRLARRGALA